jgi:PilZ domain
MPSEYVPISRFHSLAVAENRATERISVQREVRFRTSDKREFSAMCTDVNFGGIGIDCDRILKVGQRLELSVERPDGGEVKVPMMVIYRMGRHYGLSALANSDGLLELVPVNA